MTDSAPGELVLTTGQAANGGSCVARHDGRVVFVRYALPGERVRVRVTSKRGSYWHAEVVEVLEASADRVESLCPIAGVDGAGCCDLAFADPVAVRALKGKVVGNQLARLANHSWEGVAEAVGSGSAQGWRTRVRLGVDRDGLVGFHRYHSAELVTDLRCGQLAAGNQGEGMLDGLEGPRWRGWEQVHVVVDDDGCRHVVSTARGRRGGAVADGTGQAVQRVGERVWRVPVTGFWQSHRDAAGIYSALVSEWARPAGAARAWDLYGGAGLFAGALADTGAEVVTVDTAKSASAAARVALADSPGVQVVSDSVRQFLARQSDGAGVAVLDPPRAGAGREIIDLLARAGVPRVIHIGCEAASFARDIGLYQGRGYQVEEIRVFDAFPLTHHVECIALLTRT